MPINTHKKLTIFLVHYGDNWLRGSEYCLLDLIQKLRQNGHTPIIWCNNQSLYEQCQNEQITSYCSTMDLLFGYKSPRWNILRWFKQVWQGVQFIRQHQPDIVHMNSAAPCQWMLTACVLTNTPNIVQLHAHYGVLKDRATLGLHFCHYIVGVSYAAVRALYSDGITQRIHITPNCLNTLRLQKQPPSPLKKILGLEPTDTLLLMVGSLIPRKNHAFLFQTLAELKKQEVIYYVAVIGDGDYASNLKQLVRTLNINEQVFFLGERHNAYGLMQGDANAIVTTAKDEVFGLVLAEANLAKLPVIAPNIVGINSVVINNKTGFLYSPNSIKSLAKALLKIRNSAQCKTLIARGHYRAITAFDDGKHCHAFEHHYYQAIDQHGSSSGIGVLSRAKKTLLSLQYCLRSIGCWLLKKYRATLLNGAKHAH